MTDHIPDQIPAMRTLGGRGWTKDCRYSPKPLARLDADIRVTYTGVCATDIHMIDNDWGLSRYPLVPGHRSSCELAGTSLRLVPASRISKWATSSVLVLRSKPVVSVSSVRKDI